MTSSRSSVFLEVIESLSKDKFISEGDEVGLAKEILIQASQILNIDRVNAWRMEENPSRLSSILAYDRTRNEFYTEHELLQKDFPNYFEHISRNDIIISNDAQNELFNEEILEIYLKPLNVKSMMEVPIISGGKLKGIICFEHLKSIREWSHDEQHFALALTQLLTLALETKEKNQYREELEKMVHEKSTLISEINHRVKNNLAIITALIRNESFNAKDDYHKELFDNVLAKTYSLSSLQESMYQTQNYKEVNFSKFLPVLIGNLNSTFGFDRNVQLIYENIDPVVIEVGEAIPLSLISNEIITNSFKYAFKKDRENVMYISLKSTIEGENKLSFRDNGPGLSHDQIGKGTGMELINDLAEQIDAKLNITSRTNGTEIEIIF